MHSESDPAKEGYKKVKIGPKEVYIPEDWRNEKLKSLAQIESGGTPSTKNPQFWNGEIPWLTPTDITKNNNKYISESNKKISLHGLEKSSAKLLPPGTVLMTSRATIGEASISNIKMATNQGFKSIICGKYLHNEYLYYYLPMIKNYLTALGGGSTFLEISKKDVKNLKIPLPHIDEQKKISEILSTVDQAIAQTDEIIEKTQSIKKGLMQKLLTEGVKHNKFKKIKIYGKERKIPAGWKIEVLENICRSITDGKHGDCENEENSGFFFISAKDIHDGKINYDKARQITEKDFIKTNKRTNLEPKDNIITNSGTIGKIAIASEGDQTGRTTFQKSVAIVKPIHEKVDYRFLSYRLSENVNLLSLNSSGSAQKNLLLKDLRNFKITLPEINEQKHIAYILSNVDQKIQKEKEFKQKLEQLKKGLMQDLLTGKKRVSVENT